MKVVFWGNAPEKNAAIRYRVVRFAAMLEAEGHRCVLCFPSSTALREILFERRPKCLKLIYLLLVLFRRILQLRHVIGADAVYFRGHVFDYGPPLFERIIHALNPRMIFDIDDAIWEPAAYVSSPFLRLVDYGWVSKMSKLCVEAVTGNAYLAAYVRPMNPNVTIIPTCIDMERHLQKAYPDRPGAPVVIGWTGLHDNLGYLKPIEKVLQELAARHRIKLLVASGGEYHLEGVEVENRRWRLEDEFDYLTGADIGLMPLEDTPRARGKCAFKALQFMGVGTPVVLSPVGMNAEVVEEGISGFLAASTAEWRDKLERLITDAGLRERMGRAARADVANRYSHAVNYPKLKAVLERVAALRQ